MKKEKETALEGSVQEQLKCAYLGCNNNGTTLDDVEIETGITEKKLVCKEHVGQLNQHIIVEGERGGLIMKERKVIEKNVEDRLIDMVVEFAVKEELTIINVKEAMDKVYEHFEGNATLKKIAEV